jgi:pimeloyl-[acyl-carrier protein] methyl ester esterase
VSGLHVESVGKGPPLVLLHGWAMHSGLFAPLLPRLIGDFRVHLIDLPGHGRSPPVSPYTLDTLAAAVDEAASRVGATSPPPVVLGWSLGGTIALRWARSGSTDIARLVLVATTPSFVARPDWPYAMTEATLRRFGDELAVSYRLTLQRFLTLQVQGSEHPRAVLSPLRAQLFARGEPSRATLAAALELLAHADLRPEIGAIRPAAVVIAGERDTLARPAAGEWLARNLPQGSFRLIECAAHVPFLSHPDAFMRAFADGPRH